MELSFLNIGKLLLFVLSIFIVGSSSSSSLSRNLFMAVNAQDADADVFINFLGTTTMRSVWTTQSLTNWVTVSGTKVCPIVSGAYECSFINLYGSLSRFRPITPLSLPLRKLTITSNTSLYGSFNWTTLKTYFEGQMTSLTIKQVILSGSPNLDFTTDLPRSLTYLELYQVYNSFGVKSLSNLPPNLVSLKIPDNNFRGEIDFQTFPRSLTTIDISKNSFSGQIIPTSLPPGLTYLNTEQNSLLNGTLDISTFPASLQQVFIGYHPNLNGTLDFSPFNSQPNNFVKLEIRDTGMSGPVNLFGISTFTKLTHFHIGNNKFTGSFDTLFLPCNKLTGLYIFQNSLTGSLNFAHYCMDSIENLHFYQNRFSQFLLPVVHRDTQNLTQCRGYSNQISGYLNADQFPVNQLDEIDLGSNQYFELLNEDFFPSTIRTLKFGSNNKYGGGFTGYFSIANAPTNLVTLDISNNVHIVGNMGDWVNAPRNLKDIYINNNSFGGTIDWYMSPPNLNEVNYGTNQFTKMVNFPSTTSRVMVTLWLGQNQIQSTISFDGLPSTLQKLSIAQNKFYGPLAFLNLPKKMSVFLINSNMFGSSTYLIDLNHFPSGMVDFNLGYSKINSEVRFNFSNMPYFFEPASQWQSFCSRVMKGNYVRELTFCNKTMTITKSLWSMTRTKSKSVSAISTRSISMSPDKTISRSRTLTKTRSIVDPDGNYMLNVVLFGIPNKPEAWSLLPLFMWMCNVSLPFANNGTTTSTMVKQQLCCPRNETSRLYSCYFEGFTSGTVRIYFPPAYPLVNFTFINSPNVGGEIRIHELPSRMKSINVERTQVTAATLWFYLMPPGIEYVGLCDNAFSSPDISFGGTPSSVKTIRLCGGRIGGTRNFRGLPDNMDLLDLSRQAFPGSIPWSNFPKGIKRVNLAENRFTGPVIFDYLPSSLISLNISNNDFSLSPTPNFTGTLPQGLQILDMSNTRVSGRPDFSNLPRGLEYLFASRNRFDGELLSLRNVPPNISRIVLRDNKFVGHFEVLDGSLPRQVLARLASFCDDILPGNGFWESRTCDWTLSQSMSISAARSGATASLTSQHTRTNSISPDNSATSSKELTISFETLSETVSAPNESLTTTLSVPTQTIEKTTATDTASESDTVTPDRTATFSIDLPPDYWQREPVSKSFVFTGAVAGVLFTPSIPSASSMVSRQIAISRAYGGKNGTCGCPTREDPLAEFEDPLQLDLAPEQCHGQLVGIFVGNLALSIAVPGVLWAILAAIHMSRYQQFPNLLDVLDSGWPLELVSLFAYALWMPPAVSAMLCAAVRCSYGFGGAGAAFVLAIMPFGLYYFMFRRERHERLCQKKYHVSRRKEPCWRMKRYLQYLFAPAAQWVWKPHLLREAIEERKKYDEADDPKSFNDDKNDDQQKEEETKQQIISPPIIIDDSDKEDEEEDEVTVLQKQIEKQAVITNNNNSIDNSKTKTSDQKTDSIILQSDDKKIISKQPIGEDEFLLPPVKDEQEQRFQAQYRLEEKYVKRSWWFLCFEFGIRGFMTIGPAAAEAVPPQFSCTALRAIYLLAANVLLMAVWSRKPCNHRALHVALLSTTFMEIIVLCLLLINSNAGRDAGPWLLGIVQVFATILLIGIEIYEYILCRFSCAPWARGRIVLPTLAQQQQDDEQEGKEEAKKEENQPLNEEMLLKSDQGEEDLLGASHQNNVPKESEFELDILLGRRPSSSTVQFSPSTYTNVSTTPFPSSSSSPLQTSKRKQQRPARVLLMSDFELLGGNENQNNGSSDDEDEHYRRKKEHALDERRTRLEHLRADDDDRNEENATAMLLPSSTARAGNYHGSSPLSQQKGEADLFEKLDRRMRRAYVELVHEDVDVIPKSEKLESARSEFDKYINL